jgi:glycosyltransferase involved in cell wall biosynthesis
MVERIRRRADEHVQFRMARWLRLGFAGPPANGMTPATALPRVSIVLATHRVERMEQYRRNVLAQDYPNLEAVIVLHNDAYDEALVRETFAELPQLQILRVPESQHLGSCINRAVAAATGAYIAKMDHDDFYGPSYISDLLLSALDSGADITGRKAVFFYFEDEAECCFRSVDLRNRWLWPAADAGGHCVVPDPIKRYGSTVFGATLLVKRDVLRRFPFDEDALHSTDTIFQLECRHAGMTNYASDELNFCAMRRSGAEDTYGRSQRKASPRTRSCCRCSIAAKSAFERRVPPYVRISGYPPRG